MDNWVGDLLSLRRLHMTSIPRKSPKIISELDSFSYWLDEG